MVLLEKIQMFHSVFQLQQMVRILKQLMVGRLHGSMTLLTLVLVS